MTAFFEKSYKNTRTKISAAPYRAADIFMLEGWDSKNSIQPAGGRLGNSGWTELPPYDLPSANRQQFPSLATLFVKFPPNIFTLHNFFNSFLTGDFGSRILFMKPSRGISVPGNWFPVR